MNGRDVALACAGRGWWVFQVHWRSKVPRVKGWPDVATSDPAVIHQWAPGGYNVGIACGPSGLILVDVDGHGAAQNLERLRAARALPPTFTVSTARIGGLHLWFTAIPGLEVRNTKGTAVRGICEGVDTRGMGGFGIAPGSVVDERAYGHPVELQNGGEYVVIDPRPPAPIPIWLAKASKRCERASTPDAALGPVLAPTRYGQAALEGECAKLRGMAPNSGRNCQLFTSALKLSRHVVAGVFTRETVTAALMVAAQDCRLVADDGEARCLATIRSGLSCGMDSPQPLAVAR